MRTIEARPIDAASFAPFGAVIDANAVKSEPINDGTTQRFPDLASLDLRSPDRDPVLNLYVARARRLPLRISKLERHREAAQVFLPLGLHRFMVVVAPGGDSPEWDGLQAFIASAGQGVSIRRGCWHHGLIALGDGDRFAVIEGGNYRGDTTEADAPAAIEVHDRVHP